ncbi:Hypothetical protein AT6N2_L0696 [Agrobacterium tumefaciens]|nr:Hypothetical protein AT6N2_L0696 [Agrobacterium tumefaciens]
MARCARAKVHHQCRAQEKAETDNTAPVSGQHVTRLQLGKERPPHRLALHGKQVAPNCTGLVAGGDPQHVAVERGARRIASGCKGWIVEPERMGEDVVEGRLHFREERRNILTGESGVKEGQAGVAAIILIPDIGIMGIAMGGDAAGIGELRWLQPFMRLVEKRRKTVAICNAVDAEAKPGEGLPIQRHVRQIERLVDVEICQPATGIDACGGIDQALIEQSMNRLGGHLRGRDAVQRFQIHFQNRLIQPALGFHRLCASCRIVLEVQRTQHIGKTRVAAAAIDEDLFTRQHGHEQRLVDRQTGAGKNVSTVIFTAHGLFAFLLMELEEELTLAGIEEAIEGIEAVLILIDRHIPCFDAEKVTQQVGKHLFRSAIGGLGDFSDFRGAAGGLGHGNCSGCCLICRRADSGFQASSGCRHRSAC